MKKRAPAALKPPKAPVEEERSDYFRPVPCLHGYFPHIPFPHPPPLGAAYKPPTQPRLRAYVRHAEDDEDDEESLEVEEVDTPSGETSEKP